MEAANIETWIAIATGGPALLYSGYRFARRIESALNVRPGETVGAAIIKVQDSQAKNERNVNDKFSELTSRIDDVASAAREAAAAAATAASDARAAAEGAQRAETMGNMDRADIRRRLSSIDETTSFTSRTLQQHLADASVATISAEKRFAELEQHVRRSA